MAVCWYQPQLLKFNKTILTEDRASLIVGTKGSVFLCVVFSMEMAMPDRFFLRVTLCGRSFDTSPMTFVKALSDMEELSRNNILAMVLRAKE